MTPPRLLVRGIHKRFVDGDRTIEVLRDVALEAGAGEFVSVIGPSGCGKSTLFNIIAGLEDAGAGAVHVDGDLVTGRAAHTEAFAYMPQQDLLFPWRRVMDNTTLGLEIRGVPRAAARARAGALFARFGLAGFEEAYPYTLSGGMRQRAALLRTVVQERPILLLDEPFGALDALTRMELQEWLAAVSSEFGWTVLLVTHDVREALLLSDRIVVLTPRPASVAATIAVPLPRPRALEVLADRAFIEAETGVLRALRAGSAVPVDGSGGGR
ncbi:MAG: ABC transporter ATP-binding protein [Dehalococcoidia bacterium]|nr:ABC transporter ATP-binding protein [Dehalococcoidia bacterium]